MALELRLNDAISSPRFITYAPSSASLRQTGGTAPITVRVSSQKATPTGGQAVFYPQAGAPSQPTLSLTLPANGTWADFFVGGKWESPSVDTDDCLLVVSSPGATQNFPCMVRLRKNANAISTKERDRYLSALGKLNATGAYQALRNVHVRAADNQMHGGPYFLPWHRAYLLDLERQLQAIDPQVTIPYWKFDESAPNVFSSEFMGQTAQASSLNDNPSKVTFRNGHPLASWITDGQPSIRRSAFFDPLVQAANGPPPPQPYPLLNQDHTLALGTSFAAFRSMEGSPHGAAHVSFVGPINSPPTAPRDPLFFLLHCNIDRLWALWQWLNRHRSPGDTDAYEEDPTSPKGGKLADTLWPWDGDHTRPRPTFPPPRIGMPASPTTAAPGQQPRLGAMIDFEGSVQAAARLGFGYDTVPFEEN